MSDEPKAKALQPVSPGMYRHYVGRVYEVLCLARQSESDEAMVVYRSDDGQTWVRPLSMFTSVVSTGEDGNEVRRFERVRDVALQDDSAIIAALRPMTSKLPWQVAELMRGHSQQRKRIAKLEHDAQELTAKCAQLHERLARAEAQPQALHQLLARCHGMLGYLADMHPLSPREAQEVSDLRAALVADPAIGKMIAQPSTDDRLALMQQAIAFLYSLPQQLVTQDGKRYLLHCATEVERESWVEIPAEFAEIFKTLRTHG